MTSLPQSSPESSGRLPADAASGDQPAQPVPVAQGTPAPHTIAVELRQALQHAERAVAERGQDLTTRLEAVGSASDALIALGAEGELTAEDVRATTVALADVVGIDLDTVRFTLFARTISSPRLLELPPLTAAGLQLRLLLDLEILEDVSLWRRSPVGEIECVLHLGGDELGRRARAEARAVLRGRAGSRAAARSVLCSASVRRYEQVVGAVVGRGANAETDRDRVFLDEAARALGPVLERELLLERSRARERALVTGAERRLTRLAFDLHDGPIQDVLALAADVRYLQQQVYPFMLESHRELAFGRFEDLTARLVELDRALREISHSLESKSIVSRPLGEILHRDVDAFAERTGIAARLELRGDPESLDSAQRITVFRAIQEALANVREHSGATTVEIRVRARRSSIEVRIVDDGAGFEVSRSLARAAKRGRLGLVGIGERVRMLGGSFEIESRPGGPTTLSFTLPR